MPIPVGAKVLLCAAPFICAQLFAATEFSSYRGFRFGTAFSTMAKMPGVRASEARPGHGRPAAIEELEWRPGFAFSADAPGADPVRDGLLRFYNGELFQIVTTYDRQKVEGITEDDMVEAISAKYGIATKPVEEVAYRSNYGDTARVVARWANGEYSYDLVRTGDHASFAFILSEKRLALLAQAAIVEAERQDLLDAPQRAINLQKKQEADSRAMADKARSTNLPNFRP